MPIARITARVPENAASLAEYLSQQGYSVEVVTPSEPHDSFADLEITLDTCRTEQALERAAELARSLDADVLVAPGALPESAPQQDVLTPVVAAEQTTPAVPSWFEGRSQAIRTAVGNWSARSKGVLVVAGRRLSNDGAALLHNGIDASKQGATRAATWSRGIWQGPRQAIAAASANLLAKIHQAWLRSVEGVRSRLLEAQQQRENGRQEQQRRMQEIAGLRTQREEEAAVLEAENLRAQQQAVETQAAEEVSSELEDFMPSPAALMVFRPALRRQSPLVAYTRNRGRDWKMAFVGAAVASAAIMVVSFSVQQKPLPQNDPQQKQPFGTASAQQPQPPALLIPPAPINAPAQRPVQPVVTKKAPSPVLKPHLAPAPETQAKTDDQYFEEVVVHHYPTHQSAKARVGEDGVKRISDLE